jgi:aminoglycoside 6'-N-acetyltransferase I
VDGVLAGFVEMNLRTEAPGCRPGDIAYLEGWYVRPEHRRKGIGRALVEAGAEWGRARGSTEFASDTDQDYPLSPAAHAALGFEVVDRKIFFRRDL